MDRQGKVMQQLRILTLLLLISPQHIGAEEAEPERPGLLAHYRSLIDENATLTRVDARPAFSLGDSSPHPRLPQGPFAVTWSGMIRLREPGPIRFEAAL